MKEIVVGYDGSEESGRAVARAADVAEAFSSHLVVVSVTKSGPERTSPAGEPPETSALVAPGAAVPVALVPGGVPSAAELDVEPSPSPVDPAERQREQARALVAGRSVDVELLSELGEAAERVLEIARGRGSDLIVVGSRDHGFFERLFTKPLDERIAREAEADVLLVR